MTTRQRGVNRVVMRVWDLEAGKVFYRELLGAEFFDADPADTEPFGVQVAMSFEAGVELVAPAGDGPSHIRTRLEEAGEGIEGVVFAVPDADAARDAAAAAGIATFHTLDYSPAEIDEKLQGRFTRYYEHFLTAAPPLSGTVLVGEFDEADGS